MAREDTRPMSITDVELVGIETRIPTGRLSVGDRFVVRPGEKLARTS